MAKTTPLQGAQLKALEKVGIKGKKTVEDARTEVINRLVKQGLDKEVIEDEDLEILVDMYGEFVSEEEEAAEIEELAEEVEEEFVEEEYSDEDAEEVIEEEVSEEEDLEEEFEEEEPAPTKKPAAKPTLKNQPPAKPAANKPAPKPIVNSTGRPTVSVKKSSGDKFDGRGDKAHLNFLKPFKALFPEKDGYQFDILKQGFTIRLVTGNTKQTILNFDELKIDGDSLIGNLYCNRFKSVEELTAVLQEDYVDNNEIGMFRGESHPCVRKMTTEDVLNVLENTEFLELSLKKAGTIDKRMVENREKLESSLNSKKPAPQVPAKKVATPAAPAAKKTAPNFGAKTVAVKTVQKTVVPAQPAVVKKFTIKKK